MSKRTQAKMKQRDVLPWDVLVGGAVGLFHSGAVFLALSTIAASVAAYSFGKIKTAALIAFLGVGVLLIQLVSRIRHVVAISRLRVRDGQLQVFDPTAKRWLPPTAIASIHKKDYSHPDHWRPITIRYPGLEIHLRDTTATIEHLFAPGLEAHRDDVFDRLTRHIPRRPAHRHLVSTARASRPKPKPETVPPRPREKVGPQPDPEADRRLEKGLCPECGAPLESFESGLSYELRCTACDWSIVTTNQNHPFSDEQRYDVWVGESRFDRMKTIARLAVVMGIDIRSARSLFDSRARVATGVYAIEVKEIYKRFKIEGMTLRITPQFPWPLEDED